MKKLSIILILFLCICCSKTRNTPDTFKWPDTEPTCQTLLQKLDKQYIGFTPLDSMKATLRQLEGAAVKDDLQKELAGCIDYWKGCLLVREGDDTTALKYFRRSEASDSESKGYVYHRAHYYVNYMSGADERQQFTDLLGDLDYYEKAGDIPMQAMTTARIGNQFFAYGDYSTALRYSVMSDSLFSVSGIKEAQLKNSLNLSNSLYYAPDGDTAKADKLLRDLLAYTKLSLDPKVFQSTLRNAYIHFNDTVALRHAADISFATPYDKGEHAIYNMLLGTYYLGTGQKDSAIYYAQSALGLIDAVTNRVRKAMIYDLAANIKDLEGETDSLIYYLKCAAKERSLFIVENEGSRLTAIENVRTLTTQENEKIHLKRENRLKIIIIISISCILLSLIILYIVRKRKQNKIKRMEYEIELQRVNKDITAMALSVEEKDNLFATIMKELKNLRTEGSVKPSVAARLESTISRHLGDNEERDNLRTIITGADPKFVSVLTQRHPDLNEYYVKLATFIYLGMETKQIAKMLMVRPESINQSRWRLRNKLGLESTDSLESYLRSLGGVVD